MTYVDTNILIDALRGHLPAIQFLVASSQNEIVACSQVCEVELLRGAPSLALRQPVDRLLRDLTVISPTDADFASAIALFRPLSLSHGVEFFDCLVAATALRMGVPVHSRNTKHLSAIPALVVVQGY